MRLGAGAMIDIYGHRLGNNARLPVNDGEAAFRARRMLRFSQISCSIA